SQVSPARMGENRIAAWGLRVLYAVIIFAASMNVRDVTGNGLLNPHSTAFFGQLCAAELTLQMWRRRPDVGAHGGCAILLSSLVLLCGSDTFEVQYIRVLVPAYSLLMSLSWRQFRRESPSSPTGSRAPWGAMLARASVVILALAMGGAMHFGMFVF